MILFLQGAPSDDVIGDTEDPNALIAKAVGTVATGGVITRRASGM